jgi:SPP1 gp7 family putative phage head morphogenesis protein
VEDLNRRFKELERAILKLVVEQDAFGLTRNEEQESERFKRFGCSDTEPSKSSGKPGGSSLNPDSNIQGSFEDTSAKVEGTNESSGISAKAFGFGLNQRSAFPKTSQQSEALEEEQENVNHNQGAVSGPLGGVKGIQRGNSLSREDAGTSFGSTKGSFGGAGEGSVRNQRFAFPRTSQQVRAFNKWLKTQVQAEVLLGQAKQAEDAYWRQYVQEGYEKGAGRAFDQTRKPALAFEPGAGVSDFYQGTKDEFLRSAFARPIAIERVKQLAGRVFVGPPGVGLKGITQQMGERMSQVLTDGLTQGKNPRDIGRLLAKEIGITRKRAEMIARTEVIRAHAEGQLDAMEALEVEEVGVMVEWSTAGDDRVCPMCQPLEGSVMKIKEARGILPRHPLCRCAYIPANVGEDKKAKTKVEFKDHDTGKVKEIEVGQKRTAGQLRTARDKSVRGEFQGRKDPGTLAEMRRKSRWTGADRRFSKDRPVSVLDKPPKPLKPLKPPKPETEIDKALDDLRLRASKGADEKGYIFDAKTGEKLVERVGNKDSVGFTKAERTHDNGIIVMHNHSDASSFSDADWMTFVKNFDEKETIVEGTRARYVLRRKPDSVRTHLRIQLETDKSVGQIWEQEMKRLRDTKEHQELLKDFSKSVKERAEDFVETVSHQVNLKVMETYGEAYTYEVIPHGRTASLIGRFSSTGAKRVGGKASRAIAKRGGRAAAKEAIEDVNTMVERALDLNRRVSEGSVTFKDIDALLGDMAKLPAKSQIQIVQRQFKARTGKNFGGVASGKEARKEMNQWLRTRLERFERGESIGKDIDTAIARKKAQQEVEKQIAKEKAREKGKDIPF